MMRNRGEVWLSGLTALVCAVVPVSHALDGKFLLGSLMLLASVLWVTGAVLWAKKRPKELH